MSDDEATVETKSRTGAGRFEPFYRDHYSAVSRYVARRLPADAHDDVVAATLIVAWRKFDSVSNPSLAWLYRIASFEVSHERRRLGRLPAQGDLNDLGLTDTHPLEDVLDVSAAFSQLSESDAELLRLVHWERLSRDDVADLLDCSVNALNVRYHRALERFSSTLHRLSNAPNSPGSTHELPKEK